MRQQRWCTDLGMYGPRAQGHIRATCRRDYDEDAVNLEQKVILGETVEGGSTVPIQEEDTNCASSDSLSPDLGEVWQYGCPQSPLWDSGSDRSPSAHANTLDDGSATSSTFSPEESFEYHEHNIWNPMLASLCHFEIGVGMKALLDEVDMGRIYLACRWIYCVTRSSLPVANDHVSARNWPPPPYLHAATASANVISLAAENETALMRYVMDGSPWS